MKSSYPFSIALVIAGAALSLAAAAQQAAAPGAGGVVQPSTINSTNATPNRTSMTPTVGKQTTAQGAGERSKVIDINTASEQDLASIPSIGPQLAKAIVGERSAGKHFKDFTMFAARLCGKYSIDFGFETSVKIQNEMHVPRGGDPKQAGFKCAVGQGTFETSGQKFGWDVRTTQVK